MTEDEIEAISYLRNAGCSCELPLLGLRLNEDLTWIPRCRLCNTAAILV